MRQHAQRAQPAHACCSPLEPDHRLGLKGRGLQSGRQGSGLSCHTKTDSVTWLSRHPALQICTEIYGSTCTPDATPLHINPEENLVESCSGPVHASQKDLAYAVTVHIIPNQQPSVGPPLDATRSPTPDNACV